jgi:hypothetical protein
VTTLDDFLAQNEEAIISMSIADRILLARSLLDSVVLESRSTWGDPKTALSASSTLVGEAVAIGDSDDYECIEENEDY